MRHAAIGALGTTAVASGSANAQLVDDILDCDVEGTFSTEDVTITSHDGTDLAARVYYPDGNGPFPAVLMTHGWGMTKELLYCSARRYAAAGYLVLAYDSRGFGGSGDLVDVNGPDEVEDVSVLLDWLADHEDVQSHGDDPRVGMDGMSYGGGIQLLAAEADDRIDAIVPRITWNSFLASGAPNEVIKAGWMGLLIGVGELSARFTGNLGTGINPPLKTWYDEALETNELPDGAVTYFRERSPDVSQVETPTLVISGWADTMFPPSEALANYRGVAGESRLVMYSAGHSLRELGVTEAESDYTNDVAVRWMDHHVKGESIEPLPDVSLWDGGVWNTFDHFEEGTTTETYGLDSLAWGDSRLYNSRFFPDRAATYDIDSAGMTLHGVPQLDLQVSTHDELILFCTLRHVSGWSDRIINDQITPVRVGPGSSFVSLELEPLYYEIPAGDTLRLEVAASDPHEIAFLDEYGYARMDNDESVLKLPVLE